MRYPIGIQDFEKIREEGYVYVDKTAYVYKLVDTGCYYFLSRPRRFGKSLLISTMDAYFSGKKELFQGLAIEQLEKNWLSYPVLHLDLNTGKYETPDELENVLSLHLDKWESIYGSTSNATELHFRFKAIIERAYEKTGKQVVILVDEYDKPMLQAIGNDELQASYRSTLKAFYSVLKTQDKYIKFAFLTGVTKFGKVSVFSDLNNLQDISMLPAYVGICGISEDEIHSCFEEPLNELSEATGLSYEQTCAKLKEQYDGYHFCENSIGMYNPFSLLNTFNNKVFKDYWFETGTPTFLVELLKLNDYQLSNLQSEKVYGDVLNSIDSISTDPIPVIYQSGYLTIKGYNERFGLYELGFPNKEVEEGFIKYLLPFYTPSKDKRSSYYVEEFVQDIESGNAEQFMQRLMAFFADGDYAVAGDMEKYFQNCMWVILKMLGFYCEVERHTSKGRIDVTIQTQDYIYILELKLNGSAEEALKQIDEKGYAASFAADSRELFKIGVNFSSETRTIEEYIIQV